VIGGLNKARKPTVCQGFLPPVEALDSAPPVVSFRTPRIPGARRSASAFSGARGEVAIDTKTRLGWRLWFKSLPFGDRRNPGSRWATTFARGPMRTRIALC
jgi:hypothetical protein